MIPTKFQCEVQKKMRDGKNLLLVAPTGLGKTFAVTGDLQEQFNKTVYATPLRSLGNGIKMSIDEMNRDGKKINSVIHHGDSQGSLLFSEEVVITTYDQVICAVPGLPLSLPLKSGHAVAGSLLMSRLILDEVHLAWGISKNALSILLGIIEFRNKFGLQTIVLTATLPQNIAEIIAQKLNMDLLVAGEGNIADDEGLKTREKNRNLIVSKLKLEKKKKNQNKEINYLPFDNELKNAKSKSIYFSNTVTRLQETYDRLLGLGISKERITVLHNRMPRSWRDKAEKEAHARFGKGSPNGNWILLTNQVSEAGLDISADLVISDPAPVDTLVQRAGRCARWFRENEVHGKFVVIDPPKEMIGGKSGLAIPYDSDLAIVALKFIPENKLTWDTECEWIDKAWYQDPKKAEEIVNNSFDQTIFALNLFDRAAQESKPWQIANAFREILSIEVAIETGNKVYLDDLAERNLQSMLDQGKLPETSSVSFGTAQKLIKEAKGGAAVIRYEDSGLQILPLDNLRLGDILVLPSSVAYLHIAKGLCIGNSENITEAICSSTWIEKNEDKKDLYDQNQRHQKLIEHTQGVMERTYNRLNADGSYRNALIKILSTLEPEKDTIQLANLIAQLGVVAAGLHDLGKADQRWQDKARIIDPDCPPDLIGRTQSIEKHMGIPHASTCYNAIIKTCELLIGPLNSAEYLIQTIALSASRHHSSFLNPAVGNKYFVPHRETEEFVQTVLELLDAPLDIINKAHEIIAASIDRPAADKVPLMLPNDDLFPIYALIGRAIIMSDREDAAGYELEQWRNMP